MYAELRRIRGSSRSRSSKRIRPSGRKSPTPKAWISTSSVWFRWDRTYAQKLIPDEDGATIVEFGLLLPVILGSFLGVLQAGIGMLTYNSLRNLSAETSRATLVQYQNSNTMPLDEVKADAAARAANHGLAPSGFTVEVTEPTTQRIEGALELEITTSYSASRCCPSSASRIFRSPSPGQSF